MTKLLPVAILLALTGVAQASHRQDRDRAQIRCMVELPQMKDGRLKRWCLKQSEKMP